MDRCGSFLLFFFCFFPLLALELIGQYGSKQDVEERKVEEKKEEVYYTTEQGSIVRILENGLIENVDTYEVVDVKKKDLKEIEFKQVKQTRAERQAEGMKKNMYVVKLKFFVAGIASMFVGWLRRKDEDDETFIRSIEDYSHDSWDHYTHLRLAWLMITREGRKKGKKQRNNILDHSTTLTTYSTKYRFS